MRTTPKLDLQYEKDSEYETDSEYELDPDYQRDSEESYDERGVLTMNVAMPPETEFGYCNTVWYIAKRSTLKQDIIEFSIRISVRENWGYDPSIDEGQEYSEANHINSESQQVGLFKMLIREVERARRTDNRTTQKHDSAESGRKRISVPTKELLYQLDIEKLEEL